MKRFLTAIRSVLAIRLAAPDVYVCAQCFKSRFTDLDEALGHVMLFHPQYNGCVLWSPDSTQVLA